MCGIAAIYNYKPELKPVDQQELISIRDAMITRGPDAAGLWMDEKLRVGLAHRRLSIIDLSKRSDQPLVSQDKNFVISYNGEIYNYKQLRSDLQKKGYEFQTESDTEVILNLYREKGTELCSFLRGMFAFAIWDNINQKMIIARDAYGIKPLYYSDDGSSIRIASQVKALRCSKKLADGKLSAGGITGFLLFGSVPEPFTSYQDIRAVPAGTIITIDENGQDRRQYFSLCKEYNKFNIVSNDEISENTKKNAFLDSVQSHLESDVPVGIFLSSGVDSCSLLGLMNKSGYKDITAVTLSFREFEGTENDEAPLAREIADRYSVNHHVDYISEQDFTTNLPQILNDMDQPSIDGVNTWFVSRAVHKAGLKVALSGLGGDEFFGGYPSFTNIPKMLRLKNRFGFVPGFNPLFRSLVSLLSKFKTVNEKTQFIPEFYQNIFQAYLLQRCIFLPADVTKILGEEFATQGFNELMMENYSQERLQECPNSDFAMISALETELYMRNQLLRDSDWAGMSHSLEIRVPLVDTKLLNTLGPSIIKSNGAKGKRIMADAALSQEDMFLLERKKTGFGLPLQNWIKLSGNQFKKTGGFNLNNNCHWSKKYALHVLEVFHGDHF